MFAKRKRLRENRRIVLEHNLDRLAKQGVTLLDYVCPDGTPHLWVIGDPDHGTRAEIARRMSYSERLYNVITAAVNASYVRACGHSAAMTDEASDG